MTEPPQMKIPGVMARRAALKLLDAVMRRGQPLESALSAAVQNLDRAEDRALARAIASETLRRIPDLDGLIDSATKQNLADDSKARMVLRLALAQVLILKTPEHAAVSTALPLVDGGPRRLVHGVLGALLRRKVELPASPNLPSDVARRWRAAWGDEALALARLQLCGQPPLDLSLKDASRTEEFADRLQGQSLANGHVRIGSSAHLLELPGFAEGDWWVQNIAARIPALLLGAGGGRSVLDLCAAPGGKSMQLAAAGWEVTALDQDRARLVRLEDNLTRTGLSAKVVCADMMKWTPSVQYDAILLDAPCTATGIFARHPDVLHRVRPRDIAALAAQQMHMIARLAPWLKSEGRLVYATCSMEPEEGEGQLEAAKTAGFSIDPIEHKEVRGDIAPHPEGWMRILPRDHADGFFTARFKRD